MSDLTKEVFENLIHMQTLLHRYHAQSFMSFGPWGNPHRGQGRVLSILKMKPEISQKELSYLLDMSKQSLAELLSKLEKSGYIERETAQEDRRSVNIKLTEEGAAISGEIDDQPPELVELFDVLNNDELAAFGEYLKRITKRLEEHLASDGDDLRKQMIERFLEHNGHHFGKHWNSHEGGDFPGFLHHGFSHGRRGRHSDDDGKRER